MLSRAKNSYAAADKGWVFSPSSESVGVNQNIMWNVTTNLESLLCLPYKMFGTTKS